MRAFAILAALVDQANAAMRLRESLEAMTRLAAEAIILRKNSDDDEDHEMLDVYEAEYNAAVAIITETK